jgi:Kef-type K+ transport system membrane component KefB
MGLTARHFATLSGKQDPVANRLTQGSNFIQDLAIVVLVAGLVGWICQRLRLSVVVGYLAAGMLMVSSSAVISKVLQETGLTHEKTGQYAMGVVVIEDLVAVAMLTLPSSFVQFGQAGAARLGATLGLLSAFVALAGIAGLLIVPWLLRRLSMSAAEELQTLMVAGLLLALALLAVGSAPKEALRWG